MFLHETKKTPCLFSSKYGWTSVKLWKLFRGRLTHNSRSAVAFVLFSTKSFLAAFPRQDLKKSAQIQMFFLSRNDPFLYSSLVFYIDKMPQKNKRNTTELRIQLINKKPKRVKAINTHKYCSFLQGEKSTMVLQNTLPLKWK